MVFLPKDVTLDRSPQSHHEKLEEGMAAHSSILAWRISRTEEPGGPSQKKFVTTVQIIHTHTHTHEKASDKFQLRDDLQNT